MQTNEIGLTTTYGETTNEENSLSTCLIHVMEKVIQNVSFSNAEFETKFSTNSIIQNGQNVLSESKQESEKDRCKMSLKINIILIK